MQKGRGIFTNSMNNSYAEAELSQSTAVQGSSTVADPQLSNYFSV